MYTFLAETPWWLPAGLIVVGVILLWTANNSREKRLLQGGLALALLGLLIALLSWFLESDREIVERQTRQIVKSVEERNWPTMRRLLHPNIKILAWEGPDRLVRGAKEYADRFNLKRVRIFTLKVKPPDPAVIVNMRVFIEAGDMSNTPFDWELEWEKTSQGWLLREVQPTWSALGPVDQWFK